MSKKARTQSGPAADTPSDLQSTDGPSLAPNPELEAALREAVDSVDAAADAIEIDVDLDEIEIGLEAGETNIDSGLSGMGWRMRVRRRATAKNGPGLIPRRPAPARIRPNGHAWPGPAQGF